MGSDARSVPLTAAAPGGRAGAAVTAVRRAVILGAAVCAAASGITGPMAGGSEMMETNESAGGAALPAADVAVAVLYDNRAFAGGCEPAWGFSCLVTGAEKSILFDTGGDGRILLENMGRLGVDPDTVDVIVLSHAHWDHTGGADEVLERGGDVTIVSPPGFAEAMREACAGTGSRVVSADDWLEVCRGVHSTGTWGRTIPEQSLVVRTDRGLIVITGCAHPGIIGILERVRARFDDRILLVMGGFHLLEESEDGLEGIVDGFRAMRVSYAAPCHCSGDRAIEFFAGEYGDRFIAIGAGKRIAAGDLE